MRIDSETIRQLLSSMEQYNSQAFQFTNSVANALKVVALVILAILMYLEMTETFRKLSSEQGQSGKVNWYQKMILGGMQAISAFCLWGASITVKILNFLRFVSLYIYRAVSCLIVASFVSDTYKSVAIGFVKQFLAIMLQGVLLIAVLRLYPIIASADMFEVASSGDFMKNLGNFFLFGVKNVLFIVTLIGTQMTARKMMGV